MEPQTQKRSFILVLLENILYIAAAVALAYVIQTFLIRPFIVSGTSMIPEIENGQYMIVDEITYRTREPERGDIVIFKAPPEPSKYYIKRIIGLPGETVRIKGSKVTIINEEHPEGFTLDEPYIEYQSNDDLTVKVQNDHYFVMGDNRNGSFDSRGWGTLPKENIRGRALVRLLPLSQIDYLPAKATYEEDK
jgi:signal peptidase I